jgi:hypothetical protein
MNADLMLIKMNTNEYISIVIEYGIAVLIFAFALYGAGTALEEMIDKIVTTFKKIAERADALEAQEEADDNKRQALMERLEEEAEEQALLEAAMEAPVKIREFRQQVSNLLGSLDDKDNVLNDLTRVVNSHARIVNGLRLENEQQYQMITELKQQLHNTETEIGSLFRDVENDVHQEVNNVSNQVRELGLALRVKKEATVKKVPLIDLTSDYDESDTEPDTDTEEPDTDTEESDTDTEESDTEESDTEESWSSEESDFSDESKEDKKKEYSRKYYAANRTKILEKQKAPVKCPHCAKCMAKASLPAHMKAAVCKRSRL